VYIVHDPWYDGVYQGPDIRFNQYFFADELWNRSRRWGCFIAPWEITVDAPEEVPRGIPFTLTAHVVYTGPRPFGGQHATEYPTVTLMPSDLFTLAPGESATQLLCCLFSESGCHYDPVSWNLIAAAAPQTGEVSLLARGLLNGSTVSYPSYSDSIGGWAALPLSVVDREVITVDAAGHGDFINIQDALDFAADGERVVLSPGTFSGARNRDLSFFGRSVTLVGGGPGSTIIDCGSAGRAFRLSDGEGRNTRIEGITIANGAAPGIGWTDGGGGIHLDGTSPTIREVTFASNGSGGIGAGVCCTNGASPLIEHCAFWENRAELGGGALAAQGSAPELVNCTIAANDAPSGGGVLCSASSALLTDTIIWGNRGGCPVACEGSSSPTLVRCCVSGNAGGNALPASCTSEDIILDDPLFCDPSRGAFQLQECSPCVGAGWSGQYIGAYPARCACTEIRQLPTGFHLHAARPTPFKDTTVLMLDVPPPAGRVRLSIYDVGGRLVRTLVDGSVEPGLRQFTWNGKDARDRPVAAGVYFARCETDGGDSSRKLVLIR
ncbi:MAG: right-handed parallel beta-helix repeat-containing protein, partial [Candidatus Eisenbacteria bacterium]|nr:right-handed parallel beta-helix repeat-containing protein [Candidatus Eisenbacteria bacterium]